MNDQHTPSRPRQTDIEHAEQVGAARNQADCDLRSANLMLAATLDHMTQGVCFFDKQQKLIVCNRRYAEIYDLSADVTRPGTTLADIVERRGEVGSSPCMSAAEYVRWRDELRQPGKQFESRVTLRNGRTILISDYPTHDDGWVATHEDITHRLRMEEVAKQVEKMEAARRMTAGIAHEFNNLFQTINTVLELVGLDQNVAADHELLASVEDAASAVMTGSRLTQRLVAFSHKQAAELALIDVAESIKSNADLVRRACGDANALEIMQEGGPFPIRTDISEFQSALLNLARNAGEAMPDGGVVRIGIENVQLKGDKAEATGLPPGSYVRVRVTDTGRGIAPGDLRRVFEPFFTSKPFGTSPGLGLSQVQGVANQTGGAASITSVLGEGTTVTMLLARDTSADPSVLNQA